MAIGRSSPAPPLRTLDGARFTVTRFNGQVSLLDSRAARTRSRDSRQAASGRPTTVNPGKPLDTWTSTATGVPSTPSRVADGTEAINGDSPHLETTEEEGRSAGRSSEQLESTRTLRQNPCVGLNPFRQQRRRSTDYVMVAAAFAVVAVLLIWAVYPR